MAGRKRQRLINREAWEVDQPVGDWKLHRDNEQVQFDHGAQYFTMRDPRHAKWIESWLQDGVVARWLGRIVELKDGQVVSDKSEECRHGTLR
ncbi:MAG: hypothetical protein U0892_18180 [Pirellulales bacterium]